MRLRLIPDRATRGALPWHSGAFHEQRMADDSPSMTYFVHAGGADLVATTVEQGDFTIRCPANHPLCVAAPWLPWTTAPGGTSVALVSTAAAASVMWSALKADGDDDFEADLTCNLLAVTAMDKASRQLTADVNASHLIDERYR